MKSYNHTTGRMIIISLLLGVVASETAWAVPVVTMPAGSTVWMELSANACDSDGDADCLGSNQLGANPLNGIPLTTFNEGNGTWVTGSAEAYSNQARSYLSSYSGSFTTSVGIGDVFDLAYGINSALGIGTIDLLNTAVISFDLPQGVYLTSAQGGTFGAPVPVPAAAWLFASGLV